MDEALVTGALQEAIGYNQLEKGSIIHSDQRGHYISTRFRKTLRLHQFEKSIAHADEVYDNAFIESYWSRLKAELVYQRVFRSVAGVREQLFDEYIELYYNH